MPRLFRYNAQTAQFEEKPPATSGQAPIAGRTDVYGNIYAGRNGGQTIKGGTAAGNDLTLQSTDSDTRGKVKVVDLLEVTADQTTTAGTISAKASTTTSKGASIHLQGRTSGGAAVDWSMVASRVGPLVFRLGIGEGAGDSSDDRMALGSGGELILKQRSTPSDPGTGLTAIYAGSDGKVYRLPTGGAETELGGGGGTPATTVVSETSFGQASAVGTATNYAREDHTHGTPAAPAAASPALKVSMCERFY